MVKAKPAPCSVEEIREMFDYDGINLIWRKPAQRLDMIGRIAGFIEPKGHRAIFVKQKYYKEHRLNWYWVYGEWSELQIDHINGIKTDNRIENLRLATDQENHYNRKRHKNNTSGHKGVYNAGNRWRHGNKWRAQIYYNGKKIHLGTFDTFEEAVAAYEKASIKYFGEYRRNEKSGGERIYSPQPTELCHIHDL